MQTALSPTQQVLLQQHAISKPEPASLSSSRPACLQPSRRSAAPLHLMRLRRQACCRHVRTAVRDQPKADGPACSLMRGWAVQRRLHGMLAAQPALRRCAERPFSLQEEALSLMTAAASQCFHALDEQLLATSRSEKTRDGCTAVLSLIMGALLPGLAGTYVQTCAWHCTGCSSQLQGAWAHAQA